MVELEINSHQPLTKELLTIEEEIPSKPNKFSRHSFKRLYTFNYNRDSLFSIKKKNITTPKIERTLSNKKNTTFITPVKPSKKESETNLHLNNYLNSCTKNKKHKLYHNMIPKLYNYENEDDDLNTNCNSINMENKNFHRFNKQICEIYSNYQKTYDNSFLDSLRKKRFNSTSHTILNKNENSKNDIDFYSRNNNILSKTNNESIDKRNTFISNIQSKTSDKINANKSLKLNKKYNFFSHTDKNIYKIKTNKNNNTRYQACLTEGNNKNKRRTNVKSKNTDSFLRTKISDLIKELNQKKNTEYYLLKREEMAEKNQKKLLKNKSKDVRGKLVSLLNKNRQGNNQENENLNYYSKKKIQRGDNPMLIRKPTNNIEMNNLIINSFGAGYNHNEYSKKIFNLNETYFTLLENMKQRRAEIDIAKFEKEKNKYIKKEYQKQNYETYFQKNNRDKWEKKFMHDQYHYRIPEKEFKQFKKSKYDEIKKQIIKDSKKLSELITNMDAEEYEYPDATNKCYKSTKQSISLKNVKRIYRVQKILRNIEDDEQTGKIIIDAVKLKKEQKKIETEIISAIGRSGKPRFVKSLFKPRTIRKYKGISGNYFGLPA